MFKLKVSDWDVYYLHSYIPIGEWGIANPNDRRLSDKILKYKHGGDFEIRLFTHKLMKSISYLSNHIIDDENDKLALVSIPPSETDKFSPIQESINIIEEKYRKTDFNCSKEILNPHLLTRISDVTSAHLEGPRPTYHNHMDTISFNRDFIFDDTTAFILIDDITTTGTIMDACEDILIKNNIDEKSIYKLAISKTVHCND